MVKDKIIKLIDEKGWDPSQLIEKTGVSRGVAYNLRKNADIKADDFCKIIVGLNLDMIQVFELVTGITVEKPDTSLEKKVLDLEKDKNRLYDMLSVLIGKVVELV